MEFVSYPPKSACIFYVARETEGMSYFSEFSFYSFLICGNHVRVRCRLVFCFYSVVICDNSVLLSET